MSNKKANKNTDSPAGAVGIILLLLLVVALPIAITIWDVGQPLPGKS